MKGDFSRFTFDPKNRYSRVLMQQGRVQLDADWNEQLDISAYRTETEITDFIGQGGAPENNAGFAISVTDEEKNLKIGQGRFYIEGMLFENHSAKATFTSQPDFPNAKIEDFLAEGDPDSHYLVYLDVWQRHITALEDASIREVALGGADTTTRMKNVWQVKLKRLEEIDGWEIESSPESLGKPDSLPIWEPQWEHSISQGRLKASISQQSGAVLENQLYRVEVHQGSEVSPNNSPKPISFKWSRENGAIAFQVESVDDTKIQIKQLGGRDQLTAFRHGQLIEYTDETITLCGKPGYLATITDIQGNTLVVKWLDETQKPATSLFAAPIVRLWDALWVSSPNTSTSEASHIQLENGIEVELQPDQHYKTGDYWLIPARHLQGGIEWKLDQNNQPEFQTPHGTLHRYCALAVVKRTEKKFDAEFGVKDYRFIFKPITSGLVSKAGDTITGDLKINKDLYITGNVGIGTTNPQAKLEISGNLQATADNQTLTALHIKSNFDHNRKNGIKQNGLIVENGNVGIGTANPNAFTNASLVVNSQTPNFGLVNGVDQTGKLESVLELRRSGVSNRSWDNLVNFQIGRYSSETIYNSRTQLDILLAHGRLDEANSIQKVMTLRSDGNVGIGVTQPQAKLHIDGELIIENDKTIRGIPLISFRTQKRDIFLPKNQSESASSMEFIFPNTVREAVALVSSWDIKTNKNDSPQYTASRIALNSEVTGITDNKVMVTVNVSIEIDPDLLKVTKNVTVGITVIAQVSKTFHTGG